MEGRPLKRIKAGDSGNFGQVQSPHARHDDLGRELPAVGGGESPVTGLLIPDEGRDLRVELDLFFELVLVGHALHVGEDFGLRGVRPRPVPVLGEGKGIEMRRHIAGAARVGIVTPRTAQRRRLLKDHEVIPARLEQPNRDTHAGKAGAEDGNVRIFCAQWIPVAIQRCSQCIRLKSQPKPLASDFR